MPVSLQTNGAPLATPPPHWFDLAAHFNETRDCFAAYLAMEVAEVVEGEKPGNLVNLVDRDRICGLNPYRLWKELGTSLLAGTGLQAMAMADRGDSLLLYLYRSDLLSELLQKRSVGIILERQGYLQPADLQAALQQLRNRVQDGAFPHEIGIFLGYPLKDVLGFMGEIRLTFSSQGPWKIYGDPAPSQEVACRYRQCRWRMADRLTATDDPACCLRARNIPGKPGLRIGMGRC
jgi:hypothetical protein